jgi:mitochondrial fission protein ELM1
VQPSERDAATTAGVEPKAQPAPTPRVWAVMGHKAGDNAQILALAEGLGWPFEIKRLVYRPTELVTNRLAPRTLLGIVRRRSSPLAPPWPDLVISAGRRNEPACRWVQAQADRRVRLVHCGRPWAPLACFDLVVTTPQYRLPARPNVLHNTLPLQRISEARLEAARALWAPRLAHLPRPRIAVLVGGDAGPYVLDREAAALLGRAASALATGQAGSLLVTTSARTRSCAIDALEAELGCPAEVFRWTTERAAENPYFGYLAIADGFVVTAESMSMLTEACSTGKPVHMFDLDTGPELRWPLLQPLIGKVPPPSWARRLRRLSYQPLVHRIAMVTGPKRLTRDMGAIHKRLIEAGRAVWFGQDLPPGPPPEPLDDLARAIARVKALFRGPAGSERIDAGKPATASAPRSAA